MSVFCWLLSLVICYLVAYGRGKSAGVTEQKQWERDRTEIFK